MSQSETIDEKASLRKMGKVDESFYIIGVGASAGGLDAIKQLLTQIKPGFRHSLVIIQHISPDYKSLMSEILGRETTLPVNEVSDNMAVEAGQIYLIPPKSNILIQGTKGDNSALIAKGAEGVAHSGLRFSLVESTPRPGLNLPIDVFFHSLAEAVEDRAIAVILSGSGSDGSRGLRPIKDREGFVLVQDPEIAAFDGMPRSAIATGIVDMVLAPDLIVGEINRYLEMRVRGIDSVDRIFERDDDAFAGLLERVSKTAEIDFSLYKEPTLKRRVARRMAVKGYTDLKDYLGFLDTDETELNVLNREFLIGVTNFFRDLPVWRNLQQRTLPELFETGEDEDQIRVWSVGCSTGEEAYTIAMILELFRLKNGIKRDFRIFATDVNERSIKAAKQGIYPDSVREEIPSEFLERGFLTFQSGTFSVSPIIRNKVVFSVHNVIEDPPFTRTDIIVCRNLLIYLSPEVQAKIMTQFSFSLRQGGILQLGAAETTGTHGVMFDPLMHKSGIYRNTRQIDPLARRSRHSLDFPTSQFLPRSHSLASRERSSRDDLITLLHHTLEDSSTCICIVDDLGKIERTFGKHAGLLDISADGFSSSILELIDPKLRSTVALVFRRCEMEGFAEKTGTKLITDNETEIVDVSCRRMAWEARAVAYVLTFTRMKDLKIDRATLVSNDDGDSRSTPTEAYVTHLENEVQSLQGMLSATAEDLGASNEELQTTNEELIASNEELQANNEETQSINEELYTLNAENADKIADLEAATADINNLLETAELGVLVLSKNLTIRQFSTGLHPYMQLQQSDIGRPLVNFAIQLEAQAIQDFFDGIRRSMEDGGESTRELRTSTGGYVLCRTRPYHNVHGMQNGVVTTLQDITELKELSDGIRRFALVAAHDMVQPINTIDSSLSVLKSKLQVELDETSARMLEFLGSSTKRMRTRVESILDFARLRESDYTYENVDLTDVAQSALADLSDGVSVAGAKVTIGALPKARASQKMMLRVFQNLLSNAIKFQTEDRDCRVEISAVDAASGMVAVKVADNGIGIEKESRKKVFEPFLRLNTLEEYIGDGMGLALTDQILKQMGGDIEVQDGLDGGSAFVITLRAAEK